MLKNLFELNCDQLKSNEINCDRMYSKNILNFLFKYLSTNIL